MTIRDRFIADFRSIFGGAPDTDAPQPGEFLPPDPADICRIRLELERHKRRLNEITPVPVFPRREGAEL